MSVYRTLSSYTSIISTACTHAPLAGPLCQFLGGNHYATDRAEEPRKQHSALALPANRRLLHDWKHHPLLTEFNLATECWNRKLLAR